jgi:hypothetical protein
MVEEGLVEEVLVDFSTLNQLFVPKQLIVFLQNVQGYMVT